MIRWLAFSVCVLASSLFAQESPKTLLANLQANAAWHGGFEKLFLERMAKRMRPYMFSDLARQLADAKFGKLNVKGDHAVAHFSVGNPPKGKRALLLESRDGSWRVVSPCSYLIAGQGLEARQGKQPATVQLSVRTNNGPYGKSAFSFTHVTQDKQQCKNRMNIWFCHNGDLHASRGKILDVGKKALAKVKDIPASGDWKGYARAEKGHSYVLRCSSPGRNDYFVKLYIKTIKRGVVGLQWTLLSDGIGAPASIHEVQPYTSNIGTAGTDGLCGKNG